MDPGIKKIYKDARYLLQIWSESGVKVYEKAL